MSGNTQDENCNLCEKNFPRVDAAVQKAIAIITEDECLNLLEKTIFIMNLKSLVLDNSKAVLAANRIMELLNKVNQASIIVLIKIILEISSQTARNELVGFDIF